MGSNGRVGMHDEYIVEGPTIIVGRKGSAGSLNWEPLNCYPIDTTYYVQLKDKGFLLRYIFFVLWQIDFDGLIDKMGVPGLNRENVYIVKIPKPPIPVQQHIIDECSKIEEEYNATRMSIEVYRRRIEEVFVKQDIAKAGNTD